MGSANYGLILYDGPKTDEITKLHGEWCMQAWPVRMLQDEANRLGVHRTARNNSMNGRRYTPEHIQTAIDFVPSREPGDPEIITNYGGYIDCTCGQRVSFSGNAGTCRFCGQAWRATIVMERVQDATGGA